MITRSQYTRAQQRAAEMIRAAGIVITDKEAGEIAVVDFGLSHLEVEGVEVLTFFATERISARVLVTFPNQTEPEHWHPPVDDDPGKEETLRVISGEVIVVIPGEDTLNQGWVPEGKDDCYTVRHELVLRPGEQFTFPPGMKHWFQAREPGAVMYSFATCVRDVMDGFSDPAIRRAVEIVED